MIRGRLVLAPLLSLIVALGGRAAAGEIEVRPVAVRLSAREQDAAVAVQNRASEPAQVDVQVFAWEQDASGEMHLSATSDVVASPRSLTLRPRETSTVHVATTAVAARLERSFRLVIEETPPADRGSKVAVLSRVSIPVFLEPVKAEERATIEGLKLSGGHVVFTLGARGTVHIRPAAVHVTALDADGAAVFEKNADAWYVLAGGERAYDVTLPADACPRTRAVRASVSLPARVLTETAEAGTGACAR